MNRKFKDDMTDQLLRAVLTLRNEEEAYAFFEDACTINEIKAMAQRLEVARMLRAGATYEEVAETTGASTATISRVKRYLNYGADGYSLVLDRLQEGDDR